MWLRVPAEITAWEAPVDFWETVIFERQFLQQRISRKNRNVTSVFGQNVKIELQLAFKKIIQIKCNKYHLDIIWLGLSLLSTTNTPIKREYLSDQKKNLDRQRGRN